MTERWWPWTALPHPDRGRSRSRPVFSRFWGKILCAGHAGLIAWLSLLPADHFPSSLGAIPGLDKIVHFLLYAFLGILLSLTWGDSLQWQGLLALAAGCGYGVVMEILQQPPWAAGRAFQWSDLAANLIGLLVGWHVGVSRIRSVRPPA